MNSKYLADAGGVYPVRDLATAIYVTSFTTKDELKLGMSRNYLMEREGGWKPRRTGEKIKHEFDI